MNQEQSSALIGFDALRKLTKTCMAGDPFTFILDLPNHPLRGEDAAHTQTLVWIPRVPMTHSVNQGFLKTELKPTRCLCTIHGIEKQLQQGRELESGRKNEISPARSLERGGEIETERP
jgi:hypothetical protein